MGYPMDYDRFISRNSLQGDYGSDELSNIKGDLRRLEYDQRDEYHLGLYSKKVGTAAHVVLSVLNLFLEPDRYDLYGIGVWEEIPAFYKENADFTAIIQILMLSISDEQKAWSILKYMQTGEISLQGKLFKRDEFKV